MSSTPPIGTPKKHEECFETPHLIKRRSSLMRDNNFCQPKPSDLSEKIVYTDAFQRLRRIKQLGAMDFVVSSATHTRFEHSLGVSELARSMVKHLNYVQVVSTQQTTGEDVVNESDDRTIEVAALCHDLGHGPFSHVYEGVMKARGIHFNHEEQSVKLFKKIVDDESIDFTTDEVRGVEEIILNNLTSSKKWRRQIVSNESNGIDVDRLDYIRRDSYHLNIPLRFKVENIIQNSVILDNNICYLTDCKNDLEELFNNRYALYKNFYNGKETGSAELLVSDILIQAANYIPTLKATPDDLDTFIQLDDSVLNQIRFSKDPNLKQAKEMTRLLDRGKLYPLVTTIKQTQANEEMIAKLTPELVANFGKNLLPNDIIVNNQTISVARKDNWENIAFVQSFDSKNYFFMTPSILYPKETQTHWKRIYTRSPEKMEDIKNAVEKFVGAEQLENSILLD
ncbi:sam/hd domain protein, putative [Entamoeba invadens IP1]|uniref:Sam/hd domain protein, putative n=1 Tax=Entamoeba invadens IP1 TaxID=370355 RepID=A0A0A1UF61_ENTIV|nr:sam/hd domain protein, putative [Entamoeba invadens IP1]ELP95246.1 sam/hd domain protein, putative [Entamoeba invadens IP1]|eukprot:XP_004262017.1 sam/hd domain protein, putative [Entamoeba invadens IP1]